MATSPPGWYHDPWRQAPMRWWDGTRWTEHTADWAGLRPTVAAPPINQPSRAERLEGERRVVPWLRALLFLWPIGVALSLGGLVSTIDELVDGDQPAAHGFWWIGQLGGIVGIGVSVLRVVWLYRAAMLARDLGLPARREPMHAAIGWIIPIINYWWPFQGVTDLFPAGERPDRRIAWWWAMSIVSGLSLVIVVAVPFVPTGVAVALVVLAIAPALATAALEVGLIGEILAVHERLAGP